MIARGVNLGAASNAVIGLGIVLYAVRSAPPSGPWGISVAHVALVACAVVNFYNILFMVLTVSFWVTKVDGLQSLFEELLNLAGLPISVYKGALGVIFSYLILLGVAATVPDGVACGASRPGFLRLRSRVRGPHRRPLAVGLAAGRRQLHQRGGMSAPKIVLPGVHCVPSARIRTSSRRYSSSGKSCICHRSLYPLKPRSVRRRQS
jgi:hypothetical protein